jgi:Uncharacterized protein conserved in bacteria (DUF2188)
VLSMGGVGTRMSWRSRGRSSAARSAPTRATSWQLSRASSTHEKQADAWDAARDIAKRNDSEALLHGRDGKIRERNTYGRDPHPPKG